MPTRGEVILLGDAEYDTSEVPKWVKDETIWECVLRTSPQIYVQDEQENQPIGDYPSRRASLSAQSGWFYASSDSIFELGRLVESLL
jgi:hypothetical protein